MPGVVTGGWRRRCVILDIAVIRIVHARVINAETIIIFIGATPRNRGIGGLGKSWASGQSGDGSGGEHDRTTHRIIPLVIPRARRKSARKALTWNLALVAAENQSPLSPLSRFGALAGGDDPRRDLAGKRFNASYGNSRSHVVSKAAVGAAAPVAKKTVTKAPAKKAVAKKAVAKAG